MSEAPIIYFENSLAPDGVPGILRLTLTSGVTKFGPSGKIAETELAQSVVAHLTGNHIAMRGLAESILAALDVIERSAQKPPSGDPDPKPN